MCNTSLQRGCARVDLTHAMRQINTRSVPRRDASGPLQETTLSVPQLAHELNSLLDGSRRCLSLAERGLTPPVGDEDPQADVRQYLTLAREALTSMAELLERTMQAAAPDLGVLASCRALGDCVGDVVRLVGPMARQLGVVVDWRIDRAVAERPAGVLGSILLNGMRNAVEAAAHAPEGSRTVSLSVTSGLGREVEACVADSGPGVGGKPIEHGLGLSLCRQLVDAVNGTMELVNAPYGGGAVLRVRVPLDRAPETPRP